MSRNHLKFTAPNKETTEEAGGNQPTGCGWLEMSGFLAERAAGGVGVRVASGCGAGDP